MKVLLLLLCIYTIHFVCATPARQKRQTSAKAWINGKEVDLSNGGTYKDKNGNFVSVSKSGNGISMVSSSGGNGGGCAVVGDIVHECDGTTRPINSRDRQMLSKYQEQMGNFMRSMFPPGFPFGRQIGQEHPSLSFPSLCKSCVAASIN